MIDRADAVEFVYAGRCFRVFYLSEPSIGNTELLVALGFGDPLAFFGYIPRGDAETGTQLFELLARSHCDRFFSESPQPGRGQDFLHEATAHSLAILALTALDSFTSSISWWPVGFWHVSRTGLSARV